MHQEHPTDVLMHERWRWRPPSSRMAWTTGTTRENSSSGETYAAPGRVEYPPMSMMFAPPAIADVAYDSALGRV